MARTLQFKRYNNATLANTVGANGELIINTTNSRLTVHNGTTSGGSALATVSDLSLTSDSYARTTANSAKVLAQAAYNHANTIVSDTQIDPVARNTSNTASNNITIIQGVNTTQNTNITAVDTYATGAFNKANSAYNYANTASNNITIIQGVNTTQNTNITNATSLAQDAYNNSNTKYSSSGGTISGNLTVTGTINVNNVLTVTTSSPAASPSVSSISTANYTLTLGANNNTYWSFNANGTLRFPNDTLQNTAYAPVTGSWTVATGTNTYSFTVPSDGTYIMWVKGNIANGIITWNATASVTNTNVPAIGSQYAWNYTGGGSPILLTAIPNQIKGTVNTISTDDTYAGTTSNRFDFTISNTSGASQTVYYGYTKI
jgi:hypothetical protein